MIPVNSVLQVGHFPEIMRAEIDRRFTPTHQPRSSSSCASWKFSGDFDSLEYQAARGFALVKRIPTIRMVATCGVGYDNLPLSYLKERSIKASNTGGGFKRRSLRISY